MLGICHPVVARDAWRVDPQVKTAGPLRRTQLLFQSEISRGEAAVESDGQLLARFCDRVAELAALVHRERHRLLEEYVLAGS